jgi:hypothetical protein
MHVLHWWVRYGLCVVLFLVSPSAASHAQTWFSITGTGADDDEQRLEQALTQRGSVDFVQTRLQDVAETLSRDFQVPIVLARKKLEEASISSDAPITRKLQRLPLESILRLVLAELDLNFTVRDNVILISTPEDIESRLATRVYPVLDLVTQRKYSSTSAPSAATADYDSLIELITATIKPDSWDDVGGPGSIDALDNAAVLTISQTRDVHREIENLLGSLRRAKAYQGISSLPAPRIVSRRAAAQPLDATRLATPDAVHAWQLPQVYRTEK